MDVLWYGAGRGEGRQEYFMWRGGEGGGGRRGGARQDEGSLTHAQEMDRTSQGKTAWIMVDWTGQRNRRGGVDRGVWGGAASSG